MKTRITLAVLCLMFSISLLEAQFSLRGGCLDTEVDLVQEGTMNGRPAYLLRVAPNTSYQIFWVVTANDRGWLVRFNGAPIAINRDDTPTPQLSSISAYRAVATQCTNNTPEVFATVGPGLPVEWLTFTANALPAAGVLLNWTTTDERDNLGFHIQKFIDEAWTGIGFVPALTRGERAIFEYDFLDNSPTTGQQLYRLAQEDFDGTTSYSKLVTINISPPDQALTAYPNPTASTLRLRGATAPEARVEVIDLLGKTVVPTRPYPMGDDIDLNALPNAAYFIIYRTARETQAVRILLSK